MLDITFYSQDKEEAEVIEVSTDFYEWLARSEFARIGKSELKEVNYPPPSWIQLWCWLFKEVQSLPD